MKVAPDRCGFQPGACGGAVLEGTTAPQAQGNTRRSLSYAKEEAAGFPAARGTTRAGERLVAGHPHDNPHPGWREACLR